MSDKALLIINIGEHDSAIYSRPLMKLYCKKYGIDLVELTEPRILLQGDDASYQYRIFEKFQIYDVLNKYERVLRVDTDVLISPTAPDVFNCVPSDCFGVVYEDCGGRAEQRYSQMEIVAKSYAAAPWGTRRYFNSGVIVASHMHRDVFKLNEQDREIIMHGQLGGCKEQNLCNWKVRQSGCHLHELEFRFNHMSMFSGRWNGSPHRLDSFFIHHAGSQKRKPHRMQRDSRILGRAWHSKTARLPWWSKFL